MARRPLYLSLYQQVERGRAIRWRDATFTPQPGDGLSSYRHVLPLNRSAENLWEPIRSDLLALFKAEVIAWHSHRERDGTSTEHHPTPNLMSSQVAGLNFWFGLAQTPEVLTKVVQHLFPEARRVVSPRPGGPLLEPEWIGLDNYLNETRRGRQRGAKATSADFLLVFEDSTGTRHGVLIECKYSEHYLEAEPNVVNARGTDRSKTYRPLFLAEDSPLRKDMGIAVEDLLIEPFDQHLREQLLAWQMAERHELGLRTVRVLHVAPRANRYLHDYVASPRLRPLGRTVSEVWTRLLADPSLYTSVSYEDLFAVVAGLGDPAAAPWVSYQRNRYAWDEARPPHPPRLAAGTTWFSRHLSMEGLENFRQGPLGRALGILAEAEGRHPELSIWLRGRSIDAYEGGNRVAQLALGAASGGPGFVVSDAYVRGSSLAGTTVRGGGRERCFPLTEAFVDGFRQHLDSLIASARAVRDKREGRIEARVVAANREPEETAIIDRQFQVHGWVRRLDLLAVGALEGRDVLAAIEIKLAGDPRVTELPLQIVDYLQVLTEAGGGLRANIASSYRQVAEQRRELGLWSVHPSRIQAGMPVVGVAVLADCAWVPGYLPLAGSLARALGIGRQWDIRWQVLGEDCRLTPAVWRPLVEVEEVG